MELHDSNSQALETSSPVMIESLHYVDVEVITPDNDAVSISGVSIHEPIGILRQLLSEFIETAFYTAFHFAIKTENDNQEIQYISLFDFQDIASVMEIPSTKLTFYLRYNDYDVKQARLHVKKFRDMLVNPPLTKGSKLPSSNNDGTDADDSGKKTSLKQSEVVALIPSPENLVGPLKLKDFYEEVLFRCNRSSTDNKPVQLTEIIKSVSLSSYNPPPLNRKALGDLLYVEVNIADEGIIFITATSSGFFVNNSNRTTFDPRPSSTHPHLSHELFHLLSHISSSFRNRWSDVLKNIDALQRTSAGGIDLIASLYLIGKGDQASLTRQWNSYSTEHSKHSFDANRLHDDLLDNFGIDDRGAAREWNDEIQPIRDMKTSNIQEKVTKAKFCQKIVSEFVDACKFLVGAVLDGHIAPLNVGEAESSFIYVYNGIFLSRAVDTKDTFRVCVGEEACRKAAGKDLINQKHMLALSIEGLHTVLTTIIDIHGDRFVAQSIIPGVLSTGVESSARLVYGVLQPNHRISNKTSVQPLLQAMRKALRLRSCTVPLIAEVEGTEKKESDSNILIPAPNDGFLSQIESDYKNHSPIRVDEEDEVVPTDTEAAVTTMSHIGPIEGKLLQGSDGRIYALDFLRLAPRDANYVLQSEDSKTKGTGLIANDVLQSVNDEILPIYVYREELIQSYLQMKMNLKRQQVLVDAAKTHNASDLANSEASSDFLLTEEIATNYNAITMDSIPLELNPNIFLSRYQPKLDSEAEEMLGNDEATARELGVYLYDTILPAITHQIRMLDTIVYDNAQLVEYIHNQGVNLRYLGRLARLASDQEAEDARILSEQKQRIHAMPTYWLELLEIEIVARAFKHLYRNYVRKNTKIRSAPGFTLISILNHLFGIVASPSADVNQGPSSLTMNGNVNSSVTAGNPAPLSKSAKKRMKAKAQATKPQTIANVISLESLNGTTNQQTTINDLNQIIKERFLYKLTLFHLSDQSSGNSFISSRIHKNTLLRRLCQINGIRLINRDYDFSTSNSPFSVDDLVAIVPIVKSCEPDIPVVDIRNLIYNSRIAMQESNLQLAFELCQEANHWIQQALGPIHRETLLALDQLTAIFITANDMISALSTSTRGLHVAIQLYGLDSNESLQHHLQLVNLHLELRSYEPAIQHLLTCKYLIVLLGGEHHPELSTVYSLFASIANDCEDYNLACKCYLLARTRVTDLNKHSSITEQLAEVYLKLGKLDEALYEQRTSYNVIDGIFGKANPKTNDAKDRMEQYRRAVTVRNVAKAKAERELAEKKRLEDTTSNTNQEQENRSNSNGSGNTSHGFKKTNKKVGKHKR